MSDVLQVAIAQARLEGYGANSRAHWYESESKKDAKYLLELVDGDPDLAMQLWDALEVYREPEWSRMTIRQERWALANAIKIVLELPGLPGAYNA